MDGQVQNELAEVLGRSLNRQLRYYLDICARCSICKDACHQYVATKDVHYLPAYRAELLRRVYKAHSGGAGRLVPALYEGKDIDDGSLDVLHEAAYSCTGCRRCMVYCPYGIDTTQIMAVAKEILLAAGKGPELLTMLADVAVEKGENIDLFKDAIIAALHETEKELQERVGYPGASIPIDREGADVLYVALAGKHAILPGAIVFHLAGVDWTLSMFEAANYGYFLGDAVKAKAIAQRIVDEAIRLHAKSVVLAECGHAYRVMKFLQGAWAKERYPFEVSSILQVVGHYIEEGRMEVDPRRIEGSVTYHDPCQIGRNGGIFEEPRYVLRRVCSDFREMTPNREKNWCCGGGGGLVAQPDLEEFRMRTGERKAQQIRQTQAEIIASPCENCRLQIEGLNERYELGVKVSSMMDLVVQALAPVVPSTSELVSAEVSQPMPHFRLS